MPPAFILPSIVHNAVPHQFSSWSQGKVTPELRTQTVISDLRYVVAQIFGGLALLVLLGERETPAISTNSSK